MSNPREELINGGMSGIAAFLTETTCGEACWRACEDVCRCSCGGKNHGCLRGEDGTRPERTAKIDGFRYKLAAVGDVAGEAKRINRATPRGQKGNYTYFWFDTDAGAPARVRPATDAQLASWPELASYQEAIAAVKARGECAAVWLRLKPYLLWLRIDGK